MEKILFYEGRWYMFSNFSAFAIQWRGVLWMTAEHAYQASKFADPGLQEHVRYARSAHEAKQRAKALAHEVRADWQKVKLGIMEEILRAKLKQHSYIQQKLLSTGDAVIVEDSPRDSYWGRGPDWFGENHLGLLWMKLRNELKRHIELRT